MSFSRRIGAVLVIAIGIACVGQGSVAAETGSFTVVSSMTGDYTAIAHLGGNIFGGASRGTSTIVRSSGAPFVEGGSSLATCVVYGKSSAAGSELEAACTTIGPSGDKLFSVAKRSAGGVAEGGGGVGHLKMLGGTGELDGITGSCSYKADYLTNDLYVTRAECTWKR